MGRDLIKKERNVLTTDYLTTDYLFSSYSWSYFWRYKEIRS